MAKREYCDYCKKDITKERTTYIEMRDKNVWSSQVSCDECNKLIIKALKEIKGIKRK